MKKLLCIPTMVLFLFACSGNTEQSKETKSSETEVLVEDESLNALEQQANELIDEVEALESNVDELLKEI